MIGIPKELITHLLELEQEKVYEIKEYKEKRTINQNSYYWKLLSKLAFVLKTSTPELHLTMLTRYSECLVVPLLPNVDPKTYFKYYEKYKETTLNGKDAIYYKVYMQSSEMDTKAMNRLIDGLISECKECNIETTTPIELARLKELWEK